LLIILVAVLAVVSLVVVGCAPEAAPPPVEEEEAPTPEEEGEEAPPAAPEAKVYKWIGCQHSAPGTILTLSAQSWAAEIAEMSDGRLVIDMLPAGAVVPAYREVQEGINEGLLDATVGNVSNLTTHMGDVAYLFSNTPGRIDPLEYMAWHNLGGGRELIDELVSEALPNTVYLGPFALKGAEEFGYFRKPVTKLSDFKGLKYRSAGIWGRIASEKLKAAVVSVPGVEVYEAIDKGIIDGFELSTATSNYAMGFYEIKGIINENPGVQSSYAIESIFANRDKWEELPDDLKSIVLHAMEAQQMRTYAATTVEDIQAREKMREFGTEMILLPEETIEEIISLSEEFFEETGQKNAQFAKVWESMDSFMSWYREGRNAFTP